MIDIIAGKWYIIKKKCLGEEKQRIEQSTKLSQNLLHQFEYPIPTRLLTPLSAPDKRQKYRLYCPMPSRILLIRPPIDREVNFYLRGK